MKVVYLHVGLPKTGSSAIQEFLRDNAETLKELGYYVPNYGGKHISHYSLIDTLSGRPPPSSRHSDASTIDHDLTHWPEAVVLSSERLAQILHRKGNLAVLESWRAVGVHIVMIVYVRNQAQFLNSAYSQNVKNFRFAGSFVDYLEAAQGRLPFNPYRFVKAAHRHGLELRMRPYSPDVRRNNVVLDFLKTIGISQRVPLPSSRANESPGPFTVEAARRILARLPVDMRNLTELQARQPRTWLKHTIDGLQVDKSSYCGITSKQARSIDSIFIEDNEKLASELWDASWRDVFAEDLAQDFVPNDYQITGVPPGTAGALESVVAELAPRVEAVLNKARSSPATPDRTTGAA